VVVGAGITGMTTALMLARAGMDVALLERHGVGAGTTGRTTAKVTMLHGLVYASLLQREGEERARAYADANRAGVAAVRELTETLKIDCDLVTAPAVTFAWSESARPDLEAEVEAGKRLGIPLRLEESVDLPGPVAAGVVLDDQLHFHPLKYIDGLAIAFTAAGGRLHGGEGVLSISDRDDGVVVETASATLRARHAVVATLLPFTDIGGFFAKAEPMRSYAMAAVLSQPMANGMYISTDEPIRSARPIEIDGRPGVVTSGPSHKVGTETDTQRCYDELERWTRETFDVTSIPYRWSAQDYVTSDKVPYVGRSPRTDHVYVATGFRKWGLSNGTAAALMLRDLLTGEPNPWIEAFDASRGPAVKDIVELGRVNLDVARQLTAGLLKRLRAPDLDGLPEGEGRIVEIDGKTVGAFRDHTGSMLAVDLACTHLGCTVRWNQAETSWDCPCHGSRFTPEGTVIEGPAVEPLSVRRLSSAT
jgi:glycine/D-amino acid oxidase-like deaminating enzyme/nitrite reductase/ring-hydroxylating ferredoxin subunit